VLASLTLLEVLGTRGLGMVMGRVKGVGEGRGPGVVVVLNWLREGRS
jgi:hypothetical protein